jgi:hypothetical protein
LAGRRSANLFTNREAGATNDPENRRKSARIGAVHPRPRSVFDCGPRGMVPPRGASSDPPRPRNAAAPDAHIRIAPWQTADRRNPRRREPPPKMKVLRPEERSSSARRRLVTIARFDGWARHRQTSGGCRVETSGSCGHAHGRWNVAPPSHRAGAKSGHLPASRILPTKRRTQASTSLLLRPVSRRRSFHV